MNFYPKPPLWQATKGRKNKSTAFPHPSCTRFIFAWIYVHLSSHKCQVYMFIVTFVCFLYVSARDSASLWRNPKVSIFKRLYYRTFIIRRQNIFDDRLSFGDFFGFPESSAFIGVSAFSRPLCHSRVWHGLNVFPRFVPDSCAWHGQRIFWPFVPLSINTTYPVTFQYFLK